MKKTLAVVMVVVASLAITQPVSASRLPKERKATVEDLAAIVATATINFDDRVSATASLCGVTYLNRPACNEVLVGVWLLRFAILEQDLGESDKRSINGRPNVLYYGTTPKSVKKLRAKTLTNKTAIIEDVQNMEYWLKQPESSSFAQDSLSNTYYSLRHHLSEFRQLAGQWQSKAGGKGEV